MRCVVVVSKKLGLSVLQSVICSVEGLITVVTCDDQTDPRSAYTEITAFCKEQSLDLKVMKGANLNNYFMKEKPDLAMVCGWYWLIKKEALNACRLGCLGIHNSLLPAFRGGAPLVWAVMAGQKRLGSSLFVMGEGMDDGPIIHQWEITVADDEYLPSIQSRLEEKIIGTIGSILSEYIAGNIVAQEQKQQGISYTSQRKKSDSFVDWTLSPKQLVNQCRALQSPYPPLFFIRKEVEYSIEKMMQSPFPCFGRPGKLLAYTPQGLLISCGVQGEGVIVQKIKKADGNQDLVTTNPFPIGAQL